MIGMPDSPPHSILWSLSILAVVVHLASSATGGYGIFRDELYYIACANHPDIGYVDHPPLSIWLLAAWKFLFGDSLFSIRFLPAVCSGATAYIAGVLAIGFGGGRYAAFLACLTSIFAPILLAFFGIFSMNAFDLPLWGCAFVVLRRIAETREAKWWYRLGLIIGLGALNKISMIWLGAGIYTQRVSVTGVPQWTLNGAPVFGFRSNRGKLLLDTSSRMR